MAAVVRIHRPALTQEERERKMDEVRRVTINFHKTITKEKRNG